ncbi:hypothetical protein [Streptomyces sp. NRRL S-920]|uniref:hypothetical protein n=1 Tax=Streptomyces sp. NRRL S-920 TaxID=1463921 RepID=UPI0004C58491|nr:hypothetical protein [Streptomyces sp. NRRL S-920]
MTTDTSAVHLPPVIHCFASDNGREVFGRRLDLALRAVYGERGRWPWGMLAAARLLTELRLRVDDQVVFVPLLDRLRDGAPVGWPNTTAASAEDVTDQLAKSIRVDRSVRGCARVGPWGAGSGARAPLRPGSRRGPGPGMGAGQGVQRDDP